MSLSVQMLFDAPQREIASVLCGLYQQCSSAWLVAGFMTVEGAEALKGELADDPSKLQALVIGAATWRAFDAFDALLAVNVPSDRLRVHLGHSRPTTASAKYRFYRYHPMLHSKVYLFDLPNGRSAAVVGSHNLTGFALHGLNGEAATHIEGPSDDPVFTDLRAHIAAAVSGSVEYDPLERDAYAWWSAQFMDGLADKFADAPRDGQFQKTIVILTEVGDDLPTSNDVIYFELPAALGKVQSMSAEVHIYLFDSLPATPGAALAQLNSAKRALWCKTVGIEDDRGGRELRTDWFLTANPKPVIRRAIRPFRPHPDRGMQQVRVRARDLAGDFQYLFDAPKRGFEPVFDDSSPLLVSDDVKRELSGLKIIPPEDLPWFRVAGLVRAPEKEETAYTLALKELSPQSGSFILMSMRRRNL